MGQARDAGGRFVKGAGGGGGRGGFSGGVRLVGDWDEALRICKGLSPRFRKAARVAMLREANLLRGHLVRGMSSGAPGGRTYAPLSELTLAVRQLRGFGGSKPMNVTGAMRGSIAVTEIGGGGIGGAVFVGIRRGARAANGMDIVNIAEIHEFGRSWSRALTDKQRRLIFAAIRKAGLSSRTATVQGAKGSTNFRIPARPTFQPVFDRFGRPDDVKKRFWESFSRSMGGDLGRPG